MRHILCFSGGKDSTALVLWAKENLQEFTSVFCDTGWEHPITYAYIEEINRDLLGGKLITIKSEKYDGMRGLVQIKRRVPSAKARFCTEHLKVIPMQDWLDKQDGDFMLYQGIRSEESFSRSQMKEREFSDIYDCYVVRPLFNWRSEEVFGLLAKHNVKPNPLYLMGAGRVGCFPCVLINQRELKAFFISVPEIKDRIVELEKLCGRTFFPPNYIPVRFHSGKDDNGKTFCWATDVFNYLESVHADQLPLIPRQQCMSIYNLCE